MGIKLRMYHVVAINERSGHKVYCTTESLTHESACVVMSKFSKHPARRIQLEEVDSTPQPTPYAQCTILRSVKRGDYVKRKADSKIVYVKGDYDRKSDTFCMSDADDMNRTIQLKADATVFVGFDY